MESWRQIQRQNFRDWNRLAPFLELEGLKTYASSHFPLNLPLRLAQKIEKSNPLDPLLLQFLPQKIEHMPIDGFHKDPVNDTQFQLTDRLLQKYPGRALLITTGACVMNCRFCFRQNYPYEVTPDDYTDEIEAIKKDPSLHEIILSGGDPLSLSDEKLEGLIQRLSEIPHLKLLRFHTRFPLGIPERITDRFVKMLQKSRLQTIFILHTNHINELDEDVFAAVKKIDAPILTQTVLLKGINDDVDTLKTFFLKLASNGLMPYYLHQLDRVQGAAHFEVSIEKGLRLIQELRAMLPGYAVPSYVQEIPNEMSKIPLHPGHCFESEDVKAFL